MLTQNDGAGGRGLQYNNEFRAKPNPTMRIRLSTICAAFAAMTALTACGSDESGPQASRAAATRVIVEPIAYESERTMYSDIGSECIACGSP